MQGHVAEHLGISSCYCMEGRRHSAQLLPRKDGPACSSSKAVPATLVMGLHAKVFNDE